jgi:hypothetical protein
MHLYHNPALAGNGKSLPVPSLPLFEWAKSRIALDPPAAPLEPAVRHVARRLRLSPHHARTVAELAGLNLEACE